KAVIVRTRSQTSFRRPASSRNHSEPTEKNNYKAHTLIREIIRSDPFRNRKNPSVQDLSR
ncbi:MAG: hypothetical protein MK103_12145, partial [Planctomycetes bacterium]|nr:hypothetical protein [Planctomycetota bacterium]